MESDFALLNVFTVSHKRMSEKWMQQEGKRFMI